jgi:predicted XRE-type DNA-binding protein
MAKSLRVDVDQTRLKAALAARVVEAIERRRLTQLAAPACMNIDQPKVSRLIRGQWQEFSTPRLRFLTLLGQDIEIVVRPSFAHNPSRIGRSVSSHIGKQAVERS